MYLLLLRSALDWASLSEVWKVSGFLLSPNTIPGPEIHVGILSPGS